MKPHMLPLVLLGLAIPSASALAQDQGGDIKLPEACQKAAETGGKTPDVNGMMQGMQNMDGQMADATKGYMKAMMEMHPAMMQGAMAQDPDVAFNCSMIAHHQGAIAMAKTELQYGKDDAAKKMAQKTIDEQSKEVEEMTKWVEEHAKK